MAAGEAVRADPGGRGVDCGGRLRATLSLPISEAFQRTAITGKVDTAETARCGTRSGQPRQSARMTRPPTGEAT